MGTVFPAIFPCSLIDRPKESIKLIDVVKFLRMENIWVTKLEDFHIFQRRILRPSRLG